MIETATDPRSHDDVTYPALAEAFGLNLRLNQQAYEGMVRYYKEIDFEIDSPEREATIRMAMLPFDDTRSPESQALFNVQGLWSPVCVVNHNIYTLPGIPDLFQRQLNGLKKHWAPRLSSKQDAPSQRILIETPKTESEIAPYLTELQDRVRYQSIKVGSYERWGKETNTVTLVGRYDDTQSLCDRSAFPDEAAETLWQWRRLFSRSRTASMVGEWSTKERMTDKINFLVI